MKIRSGIAGLVLSLIGSVGCGDTIVNKYYGADGEGNPTNNGACGGSPLVGRHFVTDDCEAGTIKPVDPTTCKGSLIGDVLFEVEAYGNKLTLNYDGGRRLVMELQDDFVCNRPPEGERDWCDHRQCEYELDGDFFIAKVTEAVGLKGEIGSLATLKFVTEYKGMEACRADEFVDTVCDELIPE